MLHDLWDKAWDWIVRWRTYTVNFIFGVLLVPEVVLALQGFDWGVIVPQKYMPVVTAAFLLVNIWMRPRPAARARDFEDEQS